MAISFPSSPTLNQTYTYNSITWTYNGKGWTKSNGTTAPAKVSDQVNTSTGYFDIPSGTTAQRPVSANTGMIRYNSTLGSIEQYNGTAWAGIGGAVSFENVQLTGTHVGLPSGTTAQRPASPATGYTRINTTNNSLEIYTGTAWNVVQYFGYITATGGVVTTSGDYKIHTFLSSDSFIITSAPANALIEYLTVAGGGGGGSDMGGGGGAGGVLAANNLVVSAAMYSITVGAGGAGAPAGISQVRGVNGSNSIIGASGGSALVTAIGGGGGASEYSNNNSPAGNGGSGGGAAGSASTSFGLGTAGQGYNGSIGAGDYYPGGGGGAGAAGTNNPANGGIGIQNAINGTNYYWGGGGGGGGYSTWGGNGGSGGGGGGAPKGGTTGNGGTGGLNAGSPGTVGYLNGQTNVPGGNGGANTGGGGGGGAHYNSNNYGGTGGSGIVIIKYRYQ